MASHITQEQKPSPYHAEQGHKWSETENIFDLIKIVDSKIIQYNEMWLVIA